MQSEFMKYPYVDKSLPLDISTSTLVSNTRDGLALCDAFGSIQKLELKATELSRNFSYFYVSLSESDRNLLRNVLDTYRPDKKTIENVFMLRCALTKSGGLFVSILNQTWDATENGNSAFYSLDGDVTVCLPAETGLQSQGSLVLQGNHREKVRGCLENYLRKSDSTGLANSRGRDYAGTDYFAALHRHWEVISRGDRSKYSLVEGPKIVQLDSNVPEPHPDFDFAFNGEFISPSKLSENMARKKLKKLDKLRENNWKKLHAIWNPRGEQAKWQPIERIYKIYMRSEHIRQLRAFLVKHNENKRKLELLSADSVQSHPSHAKNVVQYWCRVGCIPSNLLYTVDHEGGYKLDVSEISSVRPASTTMVNLTVTRITLSVRPKLRESQQIAPIDNDQTETITSTVPGQVAAEASTFFLRIDDQIFKENGIGSSTREGVPPAVHFSGDYSKSWQSDDIVDIELHEYFRPRTMGLLDEVKCDELAIGFLFIDDLIDPQVDSGPDAIIVKTVFVDLIKYSSSRCKAVIVGKIQIEISFTISSQAPQIPVELDPIWCELPPLKGTDEFIDATMRNVNAMRALLDDPLLATYTAYRRPSRQQVVQNFNADVLVDAVAAFVANVEAEFPLLCRFSREKYESGEVFCSKDVSVFCGSPPTYRVTGVYPTTYDSSRVGEWFQVDRNEDLSGAGNFESSRVVTESSIKANDAPWDAVAAFIYFCTRSSIVRKLNLLDKDVLSLDIDFAAAVAIVSCMRLGCRSETSLRLPKRIVSNATSLQHLCLEYRVKTTQTVTAALPITPTNRKVWRYYPNWSSINYDALGSEAVLNKLSLAPRIAEMALDPNQLSPFRKRRRESFHNPNFGYSPEVVQRIKIAFSLRPKSPKELFINPNVRNWQALDYVHDDPFEEAAHQFHIAIREIFGVSKFHLLSHPSIISTEQAFYTYLESVARLFPSQSKYGDTLLHVYISEVYEISKLARVIGNRSSASNERVSEFLTNGVKFLLGRGSNVNACDKDGKTPIDLLIKIQRISIFAAVCSCMEHGARNTFSLGGRPTISLALQYSHFNVAKQFIVKGWPTNIADKSGEYPVLLSLRDYCEDETQTLLLEKFGFDAAMIESFDFITTNSLWPRRQYSKQDWSQTKIICQPPTILAACYTCRAMSLSTVPTYSLTISRPSSLDDSNFSPFHKFQSTLSYSATAEVIGRYLLGANKLRELKISFGQLKTLELLTMLNCIPLSSTLQVLSVDSWHYYGLGSESYRMSTAQVLADFINSPRFSLHTLEVVDAYLNTNELSTILQAVRKSNKTLTSLNLNRNFSRTDIQNIVAPLADLIQNDSLLTNLQLNSGSNAANISVDGELIITALSNNSTLQRIGLQGLQLLPYDQFAEVFSLNSTLQHIHFSMPDDNPDPSSIISAILSNPSSALSDFEGIDLKSAPCRKLLNLDSNFKHKGNAFILKYLKASKASGTIVTKRARVVFAGNGETGKTTLIRRLREGVFDESSTCMTDGIDISSLTIDGVEMTLFDFAGQPEYEHTHTLFFDQSALYLLLFNPRAGGEDRLKVFVDMISNCAPKAEILLVTTRADEAVLDEVKKLWILNLSPRIVDVIAIDSKSGTGLDLLREAMVRATLRLESTVKTIPRSFDRLRKQLTILGNTMFSISVEELTRLCASKYRFQTNMLDMALELFASWGYIHRLSNGDIVLKPKQLADVLKCIFTKVENTKRRSVDVQEGVLRHTNEVLDSVWLREFPDLSKTMWRCTENELSPFVMLLHQAGLAFQLFDPKGKAMDASIVPALLPNQPCGFERVVSGESRKLISDTEYYDKLFELFVPKEMWLQRQPQVTITFESMLPGPFMGRLQVKLRRMATLGGAWRSGCSLVLKQVDMTGQKDDITGPAASAASNSNTNGLIKSLVVVTVSPTSPNTLELIGAGPDSSARTTVLNIMLSLIAKKFQSMRRSSISLLFKGRRYNEDDIRDDMNDGFITHKATQEKIHIGSLRVLFPDLNSSSETPFNSRFAALVEPGGTQVASTSAPQDGPETVDEPASSSVVAVMPTVAPTTNNTLAAESFQRQGSSIGRANSLRRGRSNRGLDTIANGNAPSNGVIPGSQSKCPPSLLREFDKLQAILDITEKELVRFAGSDGDLDLVTLSSQFAACLPHFLNLQGIKFSKKRGVSSLWIPFVDKNRKRIFIAPLSPTRVQGNDEWYPLVDEALVEVRPENIVGSAEDLGWRKDVAPAATLQLQRAVKILSIPLPRSIVVGSLSMLADLDSDMRKLEITNFEDIEGTMIMRKLATQANTMLLSKQITKASRQADYKLQAQERLLQKISQQNEEQSSQLRVVTQTLNRIEVATSKITASITAGFSSIGSQLAGNEEGLAEINELWLKRITDLERIISTSGQDVMSKLNLQMDKFEKKFNATLFDLDVDSHAMDNQFKFLREQLADVISAQQRGEDNAERRLQEVMSELKTLNVKLDRVEAVVQRIFVGLQSGFDDVRSQLASNSEGLAEIRDLWEKKMTELEKTVKATGEISEQKLGLLFDKMEKKFVATLFDLDLDPSLLNNQLNEVKTQLTAACSALQRNEERADETLATMMTELKGLRAQLTEVISLQKDTAATLAKGLNAMNKLIVNVNSRTCPTTFVLVPAVDESASVDTKKGLFSRMKKVYDAVTEPKATLVTLLRDSYHVVLICEVCKQPPADKRFWYTLTKPGERVGKILPLAQTGLAFACAANKLSAVGRIFGLPTPVLQDSTFSDASEFLDSLSDNILDKYAELQRIAETNHSGAVSAGDSPHVESIGESGYCIREFQGFLTEVDPARIWANLSMKSSPDGNLCFACSACCQGR